MTDDLDRTLTDDEWAKVLATHMASGGEDPIAAARAAVGASGKEAFDLDRFERLYDTSPPGASLADRETRLRELEHAYYVTYSDVMTMKELSDRLAG
ncbi:MAG: hypothetical protein ACI9WU_001183 [Myxococcota bacterium]|jgi:hypothetical protein